MKCKRLRTGFELAEPSLFPTKITITLSEPPLFIVQITLRRKHFRKLHFVKLLIFLGEYSESYRKISPKRGSKNIDTLNANIIPAIPPPRFWVKAR